MEQPSEDVILSITEAVSEAVGTPIRELPPLFNTVDVDGLNALVTGNPSSDVVVTFTYAGARVLVSSRETVYARPIDGENEAFADMGYFGE